MWITEILWLPSPWWMKVLIGLTIMGAIVDDGAPF